MSDVFGKIYETVTSISVTRVIGSVLLLILLMALSKIVTRIASKMLERTTLAEGFRKFILTIIKFILYFLSILVACDSVGIPITSLLAVFSLFGLAVSLSVQSLLSNLMSGLSLHTLKPFEVGDYIETDIAGKVKNIGLFYTELATPDNKKVFIPNEKIMADKLINYTSETTRRIDIVVNAGYMFDTEKVKAVLKEAVESIDAIHKDPEPIIGISEYGESAIDYSIWAWTDVSEFILTKFALMDAIGAAYKKHGIKMAYNRLEVEMVNNEGRSIN